MTKTDRPILFQKKAGIGSGGNLSLSHAVRHVLIPPSVAGSPTWITWEMTSGAFLEIGGISLWTSALRRLFLKVATSAAGDGSAVDHISLPCHPQLTYWGTFTCSRHRSCFLRHEEPCLALGRGAAFFGWRTKPFLPVTPANASLSLASEGIRWSVRFSPSTEVGARDFTGNQISFQAWFNST